MVPSVHVFITITTILLSLVAQNFSSPIGNTRIRGGNLAKLGQFPYMVSLDIEYNNWGFNYCGGVIISDRFIVTAAWCVLEASKYPLSYSRVYAGTLISRFNGQKYELKYFTAHPEYNKMENNIALIELTTPLRFSDNVAAIPLQRNPLNGGERAIFAGYGTINNFKDAFLLNYAYATTLSNDNCREELKETAEYALINDGTICALGCNDSKLSVTLNDYGGPLVHENKLIGVAAWVTRYGLPDGFTLISKYLEWIEKVTKITA